MGGLKRGAGSAPSRRRAQSPLRTVAASDGGHVSEGQRRPAQASLASLFDRQPFSRDSRIASPHEWGRRGDDTRFRQTPTGTAPAIWNELSPWHSIEISTERPLQRPRRPPTFACHPATHPLGETARDGYRQKPEGLTGATSGHQCACVHMQPQATARRRYRRLHGFAASQLGSNMSPHPSRCREHPFLQGQHSHLNQHQHDWARRESGGARTLARASQRPSRCRRTFSRPLRPVLRVENARVTSREHRQHVVTFFYLL
jgi:hypothetical protein